MQAKDDDMMAPEYEVLNNVDLRTFFSRVQNENQRMHDLVIPASSMLMLEDGSLLIDQVPAKHADMVRGLLGLDADTPVDAPADFRADLRYDGLPAFHGHLANKLGIPVKYYNRLAGSPDNFQLRADNVNHWLERDERKFLLRTLRPDNEDGNTNGMLRALLSDSYFILNNFDVILTTLKTLKDLGLDADIEAHRCDLTEGKMYISFRSKTVKIDATPLLKNYRNPRTGDGGTELTAGFTVSNSEIGGGAFYVTPRPFANCCLNAFTLKEDRLKRVHVGTQMQEGAVIFSDTTRRKAFELVQSQIRDCITTFMTTDYLESLQARILKVAEKPLAHPVNAVNNTAAFLGLNEQDATDLLDLFVQGGQSNGVGVIQAVTFLAHEKGDPDVMYTLEEQIGDVLANLRRFDVADVSSN